EVLAVLERGFIIHWKVLRGAPRFTLAPRKDQEHLDYTSEGLVVAFASRDKDFVALEPGMIENAEFEMNRLAPANPAADHMIVVLSGALLQPTKAGTIPRPLIVGAFDEGAQGSIEHYSSPKSLRISCDFVGFLGLAATGA